MQKKQAKAASESLLFLLVLAGVVVAANVLGVFLHLRVDNTEKDLFSLSQGSKDVVSRLDDQMEIRAYFSEDLPPPHNSTERYLRDLLSEYRDAASGRITLRFIHPADEKTQADAERDGVVRVQDQVLKSDSYSVQEGYRGISIHYLGDSYALPRIDTTAGLEYEITQAMKRLTGQKVAIGVLSGHEAPSLEKGLSSLRGYLPTYELKEIAADKEIPKDLKALLIIDPQTPLTETELRYVDQYVMRGGSLGIFGGALKLDVASGAPTAAKVNTGLNQLLDKWGLRINDGIVADAQCGRARMPTNLGIPIAVPYPPAPIITFNEKQREHPVMFRLNQVAMPYSSEIILSDTLKGNAEVSRTVLAETTKASWLMQGDTINLETKERWEVPGYEGPYAVGVALSGRLPSAFAESISKDPNANTPQVESPEKAESDVHVLVFGGGALLRDEFMPKPGEQGQFFGGTVAFALNAIDWLANDSDLIAIRAKNVEDPALEVPAAVKEAEDSAREAYESQDEEKFEAALEERKAAVSAWDSKKQAYRWGNTLLLPGAFALLGLTRWRVRRAKKAKLKL